VSTPTGAARLEPAGADSALRRSLLLACALYAVAVLVAVATVFGPDLRDTALATPYVWLRGGVLVGLWLVILTLGIRLVVRVAPTGVARLGIGLAVAVLLAALAALDVGTSLLLDFRLFWQF
jgi:hypothetical protein